MRKFNFIIVLFLQFTVFSQNGQLIGVAAGLNSNIYGIGVNYRKNLTRNFYLEGAVGLPMYVGYDSQFDPATGLFNTVYYWTIGSIGANAGVNFLPYKLGKSNFGLSGGYCKTFGPSFAVANFYGGSFNYSFLLRNHWNLEFNLGYLMIQDFEETYSAPLIGIKYSKVMGIKGLPEPEKLLFPSYEPPDYRTILFGSIGTSQILGVGLQQYFSPYIAGELGIGLFTAHTGLKIYPLYGYDGYLDPYVGGEFGILFFDGLYYNNYFNVGLELKFDDFLGYPYGFRIGLDGGPSLFDGDLIFGGNLRIGLAFNDRFR
jgi:hypothetical protein